MFRSHAAPAWLFTLSTLLALNPSIATAQTARTDAVPGWPQFLGPERNGISRETGLNLDWRARPPKALWKMPLGSGWSSLAFAQDKMFTMVERGGRIVVVGLEPASGKEIWAYNAAPAYIDRQRQGPGPRATPTCDDGRLYCFLPAGELCCLKAEDGSAVWKTNVFEATGASNHADMEFYWGMSGSPLVEGGLVIVQPGGAKGSSVAAFRKDTGKLAWSAGDDPPGYGAPIAVTAKGRRQIVCFTGTSLLGLDPAAGKVIWRFPWRNHAETNCATPLWIDNRLLFISSAYGAGSALLELAEDGQSVREKWRSKQLQNQMATSIILDGHVFGCHGDLKGGVLRCFDLATGKEKWTSREPGKCLLIAAQGHLICLSEDGVLRLLKASPERYEVKGELKDVLAYKAWTPPALWNKKLFLRDQKSLVCLDLGK